MKDTSKPPKVLDGRLTFTGQHFRLEDNTSRTLVCEVDLTVEQLGRMMTHAGEVPCRLKLYSCDLVGMKIEHRTIWVPGVDFSTASEHQRARDEAVKEYEVDGWRADTENGFNSHNLTDEGYRVILRRWVDPEEVSDEQQA